MIFTDIEPGAFVLVSGSPALVVSKEKGGRSLNGGLTGSAVWVKTSDVWYESLHPPLRLPGPGRPELCRPGQLEPLLLLEPAATDREFLDQVIRIAELLDLQSALISEWADALAAMRVPEAVLTPLDSASDLLRSLARATAQAALAFKNHFENARETAARGMRITGQDA